MKLEDFEKLVEDWRETVDDYNREYSEGMEHERGYSFAKRMFLELNEAAILVPKLIKALKAAKIKELRFTGPLMTTEERDRRTQGWLDLDDAFAELEQP